MESLKKLEEVCQKDIRQDSFSLIDANHPGFFRKRTLEDFHRAADRIRLHPGVPAEIRSHFETARNLLIYSWFYYPFNVTAQLSAFTSVEFALRIKAGVPKGNFTRLLKKAVDAGWISDKGFSKPKRQQERIRQMNAIFPPEDRMPEPDLIREYSDRLAKLIPRLRNTLAHGDPFLDEKGPERVFICAELINQLFPQPKAPLPDPAPETKAREETTTPGALSDHVRVVQEHVDRTTSRYISLAQPNLQVPPIPFFGDPDRATVVTVGLNPSYTEFNQDRGWPSQLSHTDLAARCVNYFSSEAPCPPHEWFRPWTEGLPCLKVSYEAGSAVHLDLSPRPTRFVSKLKSGAERNLFLQMVEEDLPFFFAALHLCPRARLLLLAGSVTGKYYLNQFLHRFGPRLGYTLTPRFDSRQQIGEAKTSWHRLEGGGRSLPVFFCSSSPAAKDPALLPQRICEHAAALKRHLEET